MPKCLQQQQKEYIIIIQVLFSVILHRNKLKVICVLMSENLFILGKFHRKKIELKKKK